MIDVRRRTAARLAALSAVLVVLVLPAAPPATAAGQSLAVVRFIQGGLTVKPPNQAGQPGHLNQPLFASYAANTARHQKASLRFTDGSTLHMNELTDLVLRSSRLVMLRKGEVAAVHWPGGQHQITTATAIAAAVGTVFDVRIQPVFGPATLHPLGGPAPRGTPVKTFPAGTTHVSVVSGVVAVSNPSGSVTVHAGEWTHVEAGRAPAPPTTHDAKQDIAWSAGLP